MSSSPKGSGSRFECASSSLKPGALLKRTRGAAWICLAVGVCAHGALTGVRGIRTEQKAAKPLTTQFVKRAPRLTKPLELKKRPQPKRRSMRRTMVAVKAQMQGGQDVARLAPAQVLGGLARPQIAVGRVATLGGVEFEPAAIADAVQSAKDEDQRMDLSLELMDIGALDTGRYHALVVEDPQDKQGIQGFCHLAIAVLPDAFSRTGGYRFEWHVVPGFYRLAHTMDATTNIKTDVLGRLTLGDAQVLKAPWLFLTSQSNFDVTDAEKLHFGLYLMSGGFAFADGFCADESTPYYSGFIALRALLVDALASQNRDASFQKLPHSHPIYHCYYDFDGPPFGADAAMRSREASYRIVEYIEGLQVDGRLVAILSGKYYTHAWTFWGPDNYVNYGDWADWNPQRPLQFGINTIIFALTQEGSITRRLMDAVR